VRFKVWSSNIHRIRDQGAKEEEKKRGSGYKERERREWGRGYI
jgi:hypothetical protein